MHRLLKMIRWHILRVFRKHAKIEPGQLIDVHDYDDIKPVIIAMIRHENGRQPYSDKVINKGLQLAGIEIPMKPLGQSRTAKASNDCCRDYWSWHDCFNTPNRYKQSTRLFSNLQPTGRMCLAGWR